MLLNYHQPILLAAISHLNRFHFASFISFIIIINNNNNNNFIIFFFIVTFTPQQQLNYNNGNVKIFLNQLCSFESILIK